MIYLPFRGVLAALSSAFFDPFNDLGNLYQFKTLQTTSGREIKIMKRAINNSTLRHIVRHIIRAPAKSILAAGIAFMFLLALGYLQEAINRSETEIDRLYNTTYVHARIVQRNPEAFIRGRSGDIIAHRTVSAILESEFAQDVYFEARVPWAMIAPSEEDGSFPEWILEAIAGPDNEFDVWQHYEFLNALIGFDNLEDFILQHSPTLAAQIPGIGMDSSITVDFAEAFDESTFVYTDEHLMTPVPVILSEMVMLMHGFSLGDTVSIGYQLHLSERQYISAVVIATHSGADVALLPLSALEFMLEEDLGFTTLRFVIDPIFNRQLIYVQEEIEAILRRSRAGFSALELELQDEELRMVVQPMEQNLSLLRLLYPVVIGLSLIIAAGLSLLLMLQKSKNAAIMCVLGATRIKTCVILWFEQVLVCLIGLIFGLCLLIILGWGFGILASFGIAGVYFLGTIIGSAFGAFMITNYSPLELLQVKE